MSRATSSLGFSGMETRGFCLLSGGLRLSASRLNQMGITGVCVRGRNALQNQQPATSLVPSVALCRLKGSGHSASTELKKEGGLWVTVLPPSFPCDMWTRVEETPQPSKGSLSEAWKTSGPPWSRRRHSYPPHVGGGLGTAVTINEPHLCPEGCSLWGDQGSRSA